MFDAQITGYNKDEIEKKLKGCLNDLVEDIGHIVTRNLKTGLVNPISTKWYAKEAQEYFQNTVAPNVKSSGETIRGLLADYAVQISRSGKRWANITGNEAPVLGEGDIQGIDTFYDLDVEAIKKTRSDGAAALYEAAVNDIAPGLTKVEENINNEIKALGNKMNASTSFLGHEQAEEVKKCLDRIIAEIDKMFQSLISGEEPTSIAFSLQKFKEKYANQADFEEKVWRNTTVNINTESSADVAKPGASQGMTQTQ